MERSSSGDGATGGLLLNGLQSFILGSRQGSEAELLQARRLPWALSKGGQTQGDHGGDMGRGQQNLSSD